MGLLNIVKRFIFYGGVSVCLSAPFIYDLGYNRALKDRTIVNTYNSRVEKLIDSGKEITNKAYKTIDEMFKTK